MHDFWHCVWAWSGEIFHGGPYGEEKESREILRELAEPNILEGSPIQFNSWVLI